MPNHPIPTDAPYELDSDRNRWLYDVDGRQFPIVARSRRTVTIACGARRIELKRRTLERDGFAAIGSHVFFVTSYQLPPAA